MHRNARAFLASLLLLSALSLTADQAAQRTLTGSYLWEQGGDRGRLQAVFTPAGDSHWNVDFHFEHGGSAYTYTGTADGRLGEGQLSGRVTSENRRRVFTFRGEFHNGSFSGTHSEMMGGEEERTGTLTLGTSAS